MGHGGGGQTIETIGAGDEVTAIADTGIPMMKSRTKKRVQGNCLCILVIVRDFL
jgi:hypothetical protein